MLMSVQLCWTHMLCTCCSMPASAYLKVVTVCHCTYSTYCCSAVCRRDAEGGEPLYWGATDEGQLLLGSHLNDLDGCEPTATMFPPGRAARRCWVLSPLFSQQRCIRNCMLTVGADHLVH
jgi:hypothetical protein